LHVYVRKMIITAAKRIFNSDKICRSYSDLSFGVTFLEHSVGLICHGLGLGLVLIGLGLVVSGLGLGLAFFGLGLGLELCGLVNITGV